MTSQSDFTTLSRVEARGVTRIFSSSPEETIEIGRRIAGRLSAGSVVLLIGPLGSGKTTLAKGIALGLGVREPIVSPTYTIVSEYAGDKPLYHIDLYRIEGAEQTENLGLDDILWAGGVSLVEWGEKLAIDFPRPPVRIALAMSGEGARTITVEGLAL